VAVVKKDEEGRAVWESDMMQLHARELRATEATADKWRAKAKNAEERTAQVEEELSRANEALRHWEGRMEEEMGRLQQELEKERDRSREVSETLGRQARRTAEAERDRDIAIKSRRKRDKDLATTVGWARVKEKGAGHAALAGSARWVLYAHTCLISNVSRDGPAGGAREGGGTHRRSTAASRGGASEGAKHGPVPTTRWATLA
jgi:hypothetical protein